METRKLTDKDIEKVRPWSEKLARDADIGVDEVINKIKEKFEEFSKRKNLQVKPKQFILNRVYSKVQLEVKGIGNLQTFSGWIIGPLGRARDWNEDDYNRIQEIAKEGPKKVQELVRQKKIAWVKEVVEQDGDIREVKKAVSKVYKKMKKNKTTNEYEVVIWMDKDRTRKAYELWQPGDNVLPLDMNEKLSDGETENWNYTNLLLPNFGLNLLGVFYHGTEMVVPHICTINVYGDYADPSSNKFILNKLPNWDKMVKFKAELNDKKSTGEMWYLKVTGKSGYVIKEMDPPEILNNVHPDGADPYFDISTALLEQWNGFPQYTGDPFDLTPNGPAPNGKDSYDEKGLKDFWNDAMVLVLDKKENKYVEISAEVAMEKDNWKDKYKIVRMPFGWFDLSTIREWHEKIQAVTQDGKPIIYKNDEGTEHQGRNYNRFAVFECTIRPQEEPAEGQSIRVSVQDNSLTDMQTNAFLPSQYETLPFSGSADVLMIVSTKKQEDFYDKEAGDRVPDIDGRNGDIGINVVNFLTLFVHEDDEKQDVNKQKNEIYEEEPDV